MKRHWLVISELCTFKRAATLCFTKTASLMFGLPFLTALHQLMGADICRYELLL